MSNAPRVIVVLAVHNGERYLAEQLASLARQSWQDYRLLILDDRSEDDSARIIARCAQSDSRVQVLAKDPQAPSSALASFGQLLEAVCAAGANYAFCCDQDDLWREGKLEAMLAQLQTMEADASPSLPVLVHHDLEVVDAGLAQIAPSYWELMKLRPGTELRPTRLLSRNEITGCALACNRALLELALPLPTAAIMHDWWLGLCAAFCGRLATVPGTWVRYRQHAANVIGAPGFWHGLSPASSHTWRDGHREYFATVAQAEALYQRLGPRLAPDSRAAQALALYRRLPELPAWQRLRALTTIDCWRRNLVLDLALLGHVLLATDADRPPEQTPDHAPPHRS